MGWNPFSRFGDAANNVAHEVAAAGNTTHNNVSMPDPTLGGSIIGTATGLFDMITNRDIAKANQEIVRQTNAQNERLMREAWSREDNAVSRRKNDLISSGLSPVLAAGSAAASSGAVRAEAALMNYQPKTLEQALMVTQAMNQSAQSRAGVELAKAQADNTRINTVDRADQVETRRLHGETQFQILKQQLSNMYDSGVVTRKQKEIMDVQLGKLEHERWNVDLRNQILDLDAQYYRKVGKGPVENAQDWQKINYGTNTGFGVIDRLTKIFGGGK